MMSREQTRDLVVTVVGLILFGLFFVAVLAIAGAGYRQWTDRQTALHSAANTLRDAGFAEDSAEIQALQAGWRAEEELMVWVETAETAEELETTGNQENAQDLPWVEFNNLHPGYNLTEADYWTFVHMLEREAGNCPRYVQILVGAVCLNRVLYFADCPDTVVGVIEQPKQYSATYVSTHNEGFSQESIDNADWMFRNTDWVVEMPSGYMLQIPHSVRYHGNFLTGGTLWLTVSDKTPGGYYFTLYFGEETPTCA